MEDKNKNQSDFVCIVCNKNGDELLYYQNFYIHFVCACNMLVNLNDRINR